MKLYALKIRTADLALITLLNEGVTPKLEKKVTYFIFDATPNSDVPNEIITQDEFLNTYKHKVNQPELVSIKK